MQLCGKHISAAVNQHATVEEAVFSDNPNVSSVPGWVYSSHTPSFFFSISIWWGPFNSRHKNSFSTGQRDSN
jgi:hypothetical protein